MRRKSLTLEYDDRCPLLPAAVRVGISISMGIVEFGERTHLGSIYTISIVFGGIVSQASDLLFALYCASSQLAPITGGAETSSSSIRDPRGA